MLLVGGCFSPADVTAQQSTCYGTTSNGRLEHGVQLPSDGKNFETYSNIAEMAGRTYVHSQTASIMLAAYKQLETMAPSKVFKYAETGFEEGGQFKPHKTHRNGLSVDFMVPVVDESGKSVHLPTHPFNRFGYDIEFDKNGVYEHSVDEDYTIDYEALAAHVVALDKAAKQQGFGLWRVIFDIKLQPNLLLTKYGDYLKDNITFSKRRSWVRHDEHYHVDFAIGCK
ncbi:MAG: penicillin-insensitive murein endopeptidase [Algicola sp.]|nr:penicillin-insensitive murein endopeptidase [Algicola sp.]